MLPADVARGRAIAEVARLFFLWLAESPKNRLRGFEFFTDVEQFDMYAGVYRRYEGNDVFPLWDDKDGSDNNKYLKALGQPLTHRLLYTNRIDLPGYNVSAQGLNQLGRSRASAPLEVEGALAVVAPLLDSVLMDVKADLVHETVSFWALDRRADLVWDDPDEARRARFRFPGMLDRDPPREVFDDSLVKILPPAEVLTGPGGGIATDELREKLIRQFYDGLYHNATYEPRRRPTDESPYYAKWRHAHPSDPKLRHFQPSRLSEDYLERNYRESVLKQGEMYVYLRDEYAVAVFVLVVEQRGGRSHVRPLPVFSADFKPAPPNAKRTSLAVVFFHALEGGESQADIVAVRPRPKLVSYPLRFIVDFKGVVRNLVGIRSGGTPPDDLRTDEQWLARYVAMVFPEPVFELQITHQMPNAPFDRKPILNELRAERDAAAEPFRSQLATIVKALEDDPLKVTLIQGMWLPNDKQLIGVDAGHIYEWEPQKGIVTRMAWADFTTQAGLGSLAQRVFANTGGMIAVIKFIVWGGLFVMAAPVAGVSMGGGAVRGAPAFKTALRAWISDKALDQAGREVLRTLKPRIVGMLVSSVATLLPQGGGTVVQFLRGVLHGITYGALEAHLLETDERLKRAFHKIADKASKNAYKVYRIGHRIASYAEKLAGLINAVYKVWSNDLALTLAGLLKKVGMHLAVGFLVMLVLLLFLDFVYVEGVVPRAISRREWERRRKAWMSSLWGEFKDLFVQEAVALRTPPPLADGMLPHDPKAMERLVRAAGKTGKAASIDEIVSQILEALGAPSWEKIKRLDPWELVEGGVDSYLAKKRQITEEEAFEIGETVGTVVGLITLERSLLGTDARQKWATKMPTHAHAVKAALSEGTPRALLRLLKHPLDRIKERLKQIAGSAGNVAHPLASKTAPKFQAAGRTTRFGMEALRDAVRAELRELSATLIELSSDPALESQLAALESAYKDKELPSLEALAGADDVPLRKAILFVMAHCFRMALGELDQAFRLLDDQKPLAGSLTLGGLLGLLHFSEDSLDNIAAFER